jgi:hypothetical protein
LQVNTLMPTLWTYPTLVSQFAEFPEHHVPWTNNTTKFSDRELDLTLPEYEVNFIRTEKDLLHIPNTSVNNLRMKTWYLKFSGFEFRYMPDTVSGLEAKINVKRVGRITDDTIQLYINNEHVGDNKATAEISDQKTYGSETDLWAIEDLTPATFTRNFGIILRYQSHPSWPHRETPTMTHVELRVW